MNVSSFQSATAFGYGQLQRQAAQRQAEQLEAQARALAAQAREARRAADEAERRADDLEVRSDGAYTAAESARRAVAAGKGAHELGRWMSVKAEQVAQALQTGDGGGFLYGPTGRTVGPWYSAGSVFELSA